MRLSTTRRKDPMHLYYKFLLKCFKIYIGMWETKSTMENHLNFKDFDLNSIYFIFKYENLLV